MALFASESGQKRDPIPSGQTAGLCYSIVDLGHHYSAMFKNMSHRVLFTFECPEHRIELEVDGKKVDLPRAISAEFTVSLNEKSNLRPFLVGWRGRDFSESELENFDIKKFLGQAALLNVVHSQSKKGKTYAEIASIGPLPKVMLSAIGKCENPMVSFEIENLAAGFPESMPDWVKNRLMQSEEWKAAPKRSMLDAAADPLDSDNTSF